MDPFFAFLLILGVALTTHHAGGNDTGPDSMEAPTIEQAAPCLPTMAEPLMRDLTVAFERRIYLLPTGTTCRTRSFADTQGGMSPLSHVRQLPQQCSHQNLHRARSDG